MLTFPTCNPVKRIDFILLRCAEGTTAAGADPVISTQTAVPAEVTPAQLWGLSKSAKEKIEANGGTVKGVVVTSVVCADDVYLL